MVATGQVPSRRAVGALLWVILFVAPAMAGCLGAEPGLDVADEGADAFVDPELPLNATVPGGVSFRGATDARSEAGFSLRRFVEPPVEPRAVPETERLVELERWSADGDAASLRLKLLHDGSAFWVLVEPVDGARGFLFVSIDGEGEQPWAWGAIRMIGDERTLLEVPAYFGRPSGEAWLTHWWLDDAAADAGPEDLVAYDAAGPDLREGAWGYSIASHTFNATLVDSASRPLSFRARATVTMGGDREGVDRPDVVEDLVVPGRDTGLVNITVEGSRVWSGSLFVELDQSRVFGSVPEIHANGSASFHVPLIGFRPLEAFLSGGWDVGSSQRMVFTVEVDYESGEDLPRERDSVFFVTFLPGYRRDGDTLATDAVGDHLLVHIVAEPDTGL